MQPSHLLWLWSELSPRLTSSQAIVASCALQCAGSMWIALDAAKLVPRAELVAHCLQMDPRVVYDPSCASELLKLLLHCCDVSAPSELTLHVADYLVDSDALRLLALAATATSDRRRISSQLLLRMATKLVQRPPPLANDGALLAFFKSAAPDSFWQSGELVAALFDHVLVLQLQRSAAVVESLRCCKRIAEHATAHTALLARIALAAGPTA